MFISFIFYFRGISSTVRRCIEKETGKEFAAKIIDLGAGTESGDTNPYHMLEATRQEISILRQVMGHPYISKSEFKQIHSFPSPLYHVIKIKIAIKILFVFIHFQLIYRMFSNQMPLSFWYLNYVRKVNFSII